MGWGASAKMKRIVCASATNLEATVQLTDAVVYDMNAIGRSHFNYDASVSPFEAVLRFWKYQIATHPAAVFGFHFDSAHLIPPERQAFLQSIRYKPTERDVFPEEIKIDGRIYRRGQEPATGEEVKAMSRDSIPVSYQRMWASRAGKAKLWRIIAELLQEFAFRLTAKNTSYIIEPPSGGRFCIPGTKSHVHNWGEADQKAVALANELSGNGLSVTVCTIDWDMIIAGLCCFTDKVFVRIARLYKERETNNVFFSAKAASGKQVDRVFEYVCPAKIGNPSQAWWLLALGGVDYCKGLTRFGFSGNQILELIQEPADGTILLKKKKSVGVNLPLIFELLSSFTILRRKVTCPNAFAEEIKAMTFCMLYFTGCGKFRDRAGPDMSKLEIDTSGCVTIESVLAKPIRPFFHQL